MAMRHIGMRRPCFMPEADQNFAHRPLYTHDILPAATMRRRRLAIFRQDPELCSMNMEGMQHHVALTGNLPDFLHITFYREGRRFHTKCLPVDEICTAQISSCVSLHRHGMAVHA